MNETDALIFVTALEIALILLTHIFTQVHLRRAQRRRRLEKALEDL